MPDKTIGIGILGTASIARHAIIAASPFVSGTAVAAIGSRDLERARQFAGENGIPRYYGSYEDLLADADVDLVYIALPNRLHCEWSVRALRAGKAVLCEKPIACNASEAEEMAGVARATSMILIEAFHYRYHPVAQYVRQLVASGELGGLRRIDTCFNVPAAWMSVENSRFRFEHCGGAVLDPGCYCVNLLRMITAEEPTISQVTVRTRSPRVDIATDVELVFPGGCTAHFRVCLEDPGNTLDAWLMVSGDKGELKVPHPYAPHDGPVITHITNGQTDTKILDSTRTFVYQLRDVATIVRNRDHAGHCGADSVLNMKVIDDIYRLAKLGVRTACSSGDVESSTSNE